MGLVGEQEASQGLPLGTRLLGANTMGQPATENEGVDMKEGWFFISFVDFAPSFTRREFCFPRQFYVWDFPGQIDFFDNTFDMDLFFGSCGALVFVIDAQDDYIDALA